MIKEIWCTLGPSSLNDHVIKRLEEIGVSLFRLNLSHTKIDKLAHTLKFIQSQTRVPVCLDTEGAQVRTGDLRDGKIQVRENSLVKIYRKSFAGDAEGFNLYPEYIVDKLIIGDLLRIDADVLAQVIEIEADYVALWVLNGGQIGQNKAVTVLEREIEMPALTEKDYTAMAIGKGMGIRHVALSFANRALDVDEIRATAAPNATVISKIECLNGLANLPEIVAKSDAILIDRGDLSRQVPIEQIPVVQKEIIGYARAMGSRVYVATNLMESMVTSPTPTRAEVNDVFNTLSDGADGLVLAAESAIGAYPVAAANMVHKIIREYENTHRWHPVKYASEPISLLIEPHGGALVNREQFLTNPEELNHLKTLEIRDTDLMDCAQIANGTYSPLTGFMDARQLKSVLNEYRLPNGLAWTMPVVLQADEEKIRHIGVGERVTLTNSRGEIYATMTVSEIYEFDFKEVAEKWFGTTSTRHPGVARLAGGGNCFVAGDIVMVRRLESLHQRFELSPAETRLIFTQKGWSRVVGFHTRNVPHRAHEFIQLTALERVHADGLYISPVIGPKKSGDFLEEPVLKSYQILLNSEVYPPGKVVLGAFSTYPRYCGPREAVFTALCRKNMGCSHFIVGRDHAGVGGFYKDTQTRELFNRLENIGIKPVFFEPVVYDPKINAHTTALNGNTLSISGSQARETLLNNQPLPEWFMRSQIQEYLRGEIASGKPIFYE